VLARLAGGRPVARRAGGPSPAAFPPVRAAA